MKNVWTVTTVADNDLLEIFENFEDAQDFVIEMLWDCLDQIGEEKRIFLQECKTCGTPFLDEWNAENFYKFCTRIINGPCNCEPFGYMKIEKKPLW